MAVIPKTREIRSAKKEKDFQKDLVLVLQVEEVVLLRAGHLEEVLHQRVGLLEEVLQRADLLEEVLLRALTLWKQSMFLDYHLEQQMRSSTSAFLNMEK